ncbi:MAG: hypothetical protein RL522_2592 [Pseudomonadota bacterium]|jgi:hypothetical protein
MNLHSPLPRRQPGYPRPLLTLGTLATGLAIGLAASSAPRAWAQPAHEAPAGKGMAVSFPDVFVSSDSEGFLTRKVSAGLYPWYEHGDRYTGLQVQRNTYAQGTWQAQGEALSLVRRAINPRNALGWQAKVGIDQLDSKQLLTLDGSYSLALTPATTAELVLNRERVETETALRDGLHQTSAGAGLWHQLHERLNVGGMLQVMHLSDGNTRTQVRLRGVYDLLPEHGVNVQVRYRGYRASDTGVPRRYFNPGEFEEAMAVVGVRRRLEGWVLRGTLGLGRQQVNADTSTQTQLAEFSATSPVTGPVFWRVRAGYNRSAGLQGPDYRYRYLVQELYAPF